MATTLARKRAAEVSSVGFIDRAGNSRRKTALSGLVDELVVAFFVAMAVMWVVTTIAGIFG
ncbi:MAG: hypothetical protein WCD12_04535 [Candidatus Binatus sp.]|jgi:hypothetical protein|uniref:hypothetical protein n=1 Tax=Candidatus Binatus sp. TaxID=2811406 RepID=UPI003C758ADE